MIPNAGRKGIHPSEVDELGHIKKAGMTPEEKAKLDKAIVTPITTPTEKELFGVDTGNSQIMVKVGDGLTLDGSTSPFTLKADSSGGLEWADGTLVDLSGVSVDTNRAYCRKLGDMVFLGIVYNKSGTGFIKDTTFGYVPEGFRPGSAYYFTGLTNASNVIVRLTVDEGGALKIIDDIPTGTNKIYAYGCYKIRTI